MAGNRELEPGVAELGNHRPDIVANSNHLVLNLLDLAFLCFYLSLAIVYLSLQVGLGILLLL